MPLRGPEEKGIRREWARRYKVNGFPDCGGLNKQGDPANCEPHELTEADNVRLRDGGAYSRGGQEPMNADHPMDGCVYGMIDVEGTVSLLVYVPNGTDGPHVDKYRSENVPAYGPLLDLATGGNGGRYQFVKFGGKLYVFSAGESSTPGLVGLWEVVLPLPGADPTLAEGQTKLAFALELAEFASAVVRDERLSLPSDAGPDDETPLGPVMYIGAATDGIVRRWDGTSLVADSASLGAGQQIMAIFQEDIFACGNDYVKKRDGGAWTSIGALPVGVTNFTPKCAMEVQDRLLIGGHDPTIVPAPAIDGPAVILSWDGATFALAHWVGGMAVAPAKSGVDVTSMDIFNGALNYSWSHHEGTGTSGRQLVGATLDGVVFNDVAIEFLSENDQVPSGRILAANGYLFLSVITDTGVTNTVTLYQVDANGVKTLLKEYAAGTNDDQPTDIVVFP